MSLRTRLLLAAGVIMFVVCAGAVVILQNQTAFLIGQVDGQLDQARRFVRPELAPSEVPGNPAGQAGENISYFYIGVLEDGELRTVVAGSLLDDAPAVEGVAKGSDSDQPYTVASRSGRTRFRVISISREGQPEKLIVGRPLDEVDNTVGRLRRALFAGALVIAIALLLVVWWTERLSLRPIGRMTETADAVAAGDRHVRATAEKPGTEAGRLSGAFNLMLDERDASEERLRQFVADVSHELRTPLTSIRGYLDLYRVGAFKMPEELDDAVGRVRREASRMHDLVEDLLLLANLDQRRPLRSQPVDVEWLIMDVATDARVLQPTRTIEVHIDDEGGRGTTITGDLHRLQQVLSALVANALTYTDTDAGLELGLQARDEGIRLTVADHGPGLPDADAARVFDRFFRAEPSRARRTGGSGLGLSIVQSIVEAHHGAIALETAPGRGCLFRIDLPWGPALAA